jgi:hypothetical protein
MECPGSQTMVFDRNTIENETTGSLKSQLNQWPVQLHLISPTAPYFHSADVVLTADCVAYALGGYHQNYLKGKSIAIACPKLDEGQDIYTDKIISWIDDARINTLTVMIMQVPCCSGLQQLAIEAMQNAKRKIPVKSIVVGLQGDILHEDWVTV